VSSPSEQWDTGGALMNMNLRGQVLRQLWHANFGNVTIIFALSCIVLLAFTGAAIDYGRYSNIKNAYSTAADSAVLGAIASAVNAEKVSGASATEAGRAKIAMAAKLTALNIWQANLRGLGLIATTPPAVDVQKTDNLWQASLTFDDSVKMSIMGIFGVTTGDIHIATDSSSQVGKTKEYWDYSIVVDDSSSMGLGATPAIMSAMLANSKIKCSFACHYDAAGKSDTFAIARAAGYKLRIDLVDEAVDGMIATMKAWVIDSNITGSLYGMNNNIQNLVKPTTELQLLADFDIKIALTPSSSGNTNYRASMSTLTSLAGKSGEGKSSASPKKAVFIVTDGVHDTVDPESNATKLITKDHYDGPMDPAFCSKLKENGVLIGVLYIDYYVQPGYEGYISGFKSKMLPNLQSCATDGLFFNATSPDGINKALQDMLVAAMKISGVRLTQ
jgi:Flp pilus assembly protein TadG